MLPTNECAGAFRAGDVEFVCRHCRHACGLSIKVEAVIYNPSMLLGQVIGAQGLASRAEREAERRFRMARALARCPRCRARTRSSAHAMLILRALLFGAVVGLPGAIVGGMVAISLDASLPSGLLFGLIAAAAIATVTRYRGRLADVARWTEFDDDGS